MRKIFFCFICTTILLINYTNIKDNSDNLKNEVSDTCEFLMGHDIPINNLFITNAYAKALSDSFIKCMYVNNYKRKIKKYDSGDSIGFLNLNIIPTTIAMPREDSTTYDLIYWVTDQSCSRYYDSILRTEVSTINGMRFSILEKRIICFITTDRKLIIDSDFMKINQKVNDSDFIDYLKMNEEKLNLNLKSFIK